MARTDSRAFKLLRAQFRAQCEANEEPCWICTQAIDYEAEHDDYANDDRFQLDHYYPVSKHPELKDDPANFRPAHARCNQVRGSSTTVTTLNNLSRDWTRVDS